MRTYILVAFILAGPAVLSSPVYAQKSLKPAVERIAHKVSAASPARQAASAVLKTSAGAAALQGPSSDADRVEASLRRALKQSHELKSIPVIRPTPAENLQTNAFRLTPLQRQQAVQKYQRLMSRFAELKASWDARVVYWRLEHGFNAMTPLERQTRLREGLTLAAEMAAELEYLFRDDAPLQQAYDYLVKMAETLEPSFHGILTRKPLEPRKDRPFDAEQFFLRRPGETPVRDVDWDDYHLSSGAARDRALELAEQLPQNLRIAVVNDHDGMKSAIEYWAGLGYLGRGASVSFYKTADLLLGELSYGRTFDVIATDLQVPGGGGRYLTYLLRKSGSDCPVIGLSEYREEDVGAEKLFNLGFDGYIFVNDTFRAYTGYRVFPKALKNYFDMKKENDWLH